MRTKMTSRERVIRALEFRCPDRIPVHHHVNKGSWVKHGKQLEAILRRYPGFPEEIQQGPPGSTWAVEDDFALIGPRSFKYGPPGVGRSQDEWGCIWNKLDPSFLTGHVEYSPLADWDALNDYNWPDPLENWRFNRPEIEATVSWARKRGKFLVVDDHTLFERAQALRGMEELFMDIMTNPSRATFILDKLLDYLLRDIEAFAKYEPDGIRLGDDWGMNSQLMIPPAKWRELFKPYYRKLFDAVHNLGAKVWFHTDGYITDIVPDLMELGVDLLNTQETLMGFDDLAGLIRGKMCLQAEPDRQWLLPWGTDEQVDQGIKKLVEAFATPEGGLIAHGAVQPDVPLANVEACYSAFMQYGNNILRKGNP